MWYYQEITLHPTADVPESFMMSNIYGKLHLALSGSRDTEGKIHCGVSFPEYSLNPKTLGKKIRVLSQNKDALKGLSLDSVFSLLIKRRYIHLTPIRAVPIQLVKHYAVYRRLGLANARCKARRFAKRHAVSVDEAESFFPREKNDELPYVWFNSHSTGQNFGLIIQKQLVEGKECHPEDMSLDFSSYGLSGHQFVPEF